MFLGSFETLKFAQTSRPCFLGAVGTRPVTSEKKDKGGEWDGAGEAPSLPGLPPARTPKQLEHGCRVIHAGFLAVFCFEIRGRSYFYVLASTVLFPEMHTALQSRPSVHASKPFCSRMQTYLQSRTYPK